MKTTRALLALAIPPVTFADLAHAQPDNTPQVAYTVRGLANNDRFGVDVINMGDLDNDGIDDWAAGADRGDGPIGYISVVSGASGIRLYDKNGMQGSDRYGIAIGNVGDIDDDNFNDLLVASIGNRGFHIPDRYQFVSGVDGAGIRTITRAVDEVISGSVSGVGNQTGDGFPDALIGYGLGTNGFAQLIDSQNTTPPVNLFGDSNGDQFGYEVSEAGDVNNDGLEDFIIGAISHDPSGRVNAGQAKVFSGSDRSVLYTLTGDTAGDRFGVSLDSLGDINDDGHDDFIVGADQFGTNGRGYARVFSGIDGSELFTVFGDDLGDRLGFTVAGGGDLNGDGTPDFLVGSTQDNINGSRSGSVRGYSGRDGSELFTVFGSPGDQFGRSIDILHDINGDGLDDFIAGANEAGTGRSGYVRAFTSVPEPGTSAALVIGAAALLRRRHLSRA